MVTTSNPARPFPGAGVYPLDTGHFDEAFAQTGTSRPPYAMVMDALARQDLVELRERVRSNVEEIGLSFGPGRPMTVDPVPRVIDAAEWEALEAGLLQRARALNAFVLDATQWFLALLAAAIGLTIAALVWRLPVIVRWEAEIDEPNEPRSPMEESAKPA